MKIFLGVLLLVCLTGVLVGGVMIYFDPANDLARAACYMGCTGAVCFFLSQHGWQGRRQK